MELYLYDFSEYLDSDVDEHGFFKYPKLDSYWVEQSRHPFFIKVDGHFAGFVLVNSSCKYASNKNTCSISQFFVMKKYRKANVGNFAAKHVFDLLDCEWEVRILNTNKPALSFWHKVICEYTKGEYTFHSNALPDWDGVGYTFTTKEK